MKNIAIITARSGSKGLKDKNIRELNGKPLMAYSIIAAQKSGLFDEIMVSTDSSRYAEIAKAYGASVPFLRSEELSGDKAGSWDVVREVLQGYLRDGRTFDTVCLLQPTSPLRTDEDIRNGYALLEEKNAAAVTSVCEMDHSPRWSMVLPEDGCLDEFWKHATPVPRQQLAVYYRINGALYIRKINYTDNAAVLLEEHDYAYIMDRDRSVDIDCADDFELAEFYLTKKSR